MPARVKAKSWTGTAMDSGSRNLANGKLPRMNKVSGMMKLTRLTLMM